jgi:GT2 family glycosyltransferase
VVAFVDDDALPIDGWLGALTAPFASERVSVTGGRVRLRFAGDPPAWWDGGLADYLAAYDLGPEAIDLGPRPWYDAPRALNMAARRSTLLAVGGFDPRLGPRADRPSVGEEADLCLRLLARGAEVRYVPDAVVEHLVDPSRLRPAWFFRRAFWTGWSEAMIDLTHRRLRQVAGRLRWHYGRRVLRLPYRPGSAPDPGRLRLECERREAWGYLLAVLRHLPARGGRP